VFFYTLFSYNASKVRKKMRISVKRRVIIGCVAVALAFLGFYLVSILCPSPTEEAFDFFETPFLYGTIVFSVIWGISILYRI
jgi:hypothetical protein